MKKLIFAYLFLGALFTCQVIVVLRTHGIKEQIEKMIKKDRSQIDRSQIDKITRKLALENNIVRRGNFLFYVPHYPLDYVESYPVDHEEIFFELPILKKMDNFLPDNAVILDIGANVGNHTIYWLKASPKRAKYVYSFEVVSDTFKILKKNVELNRLTNKTTLFDFGLGAHNSNASLSFTKPEDMAIASVEEDSNGDFVVKKLDDVKFNHDKIDFVKMDVEGMEVDVMKGGMEFFKKYKPMLWVEIWPSKEIDHRFKEGNKEEFDKIMSSLGYEMIEQLDYENYLYKYTGKYK